MAFCLRGPRKGPAPIVSNRIKKASPGRQRLIFTLAARGCLMLRFDSFAVRDFALIDAQAEAAIRIGTGPRLKNHRSALLPIIRERYKRAIVAFLALRQLHHPRLLGCPGSSPKCNLSNHI